MSQVRQGFAVDDSKKFYLDRGEPITWHQEVNSEKPSEMKSIEHSNSVTSLLLLPDGRVVSGSNDNTIKIWNVKTKNSFGLETKECEKTLTGHSNSVKALLLLSDGRVASGSLDKTIKVWNVETGQCEKTLMDHDDMIYCLLQLPDGRLMSASRDHTIKRWNVATGECEKTFTGHTEYVYSIILLSKDRVASASLDGTIKIWNVQTGECVKTLIGHRDAVRFLLLLADGRLLSWSYDGTFRIWNVKTGRCKKTLEGPGRPFTSLLLLPDARVASASYDNTIKIWNVKANHFSGYITGECEKTLTGHRDHISSLLLLPDGRVASGSLDQTIKVWNVKTGQCEDTFVENSGQINFLLLLQDGRVLSDCSDKNGTIKLWHVGLRQHSQEEKLNDATFNTTTLHQLIDLAKPDESVKFDEATFLKSQADLAKLTQQMQYVDGIVLEALQGKAAELQNVIDKESLVIQSQQERRVILTDDKLSDYYYVFITQFTDVWLACKTIHSGKVKNTEMTPIDRIPAILDKGVEYLSFPGIALLKDIATLGIKQWSARDKKMAVNRMANYFGGLVEGDTLIEAISRQLTLAQAQSIQALVLKKAGVFKRVVNGLKGIKNKITANDIDNMIRERADEDCQKIITAIMKGELKPHPTLTDLNTLVKVVMGNHSISVTSTTIKSSDKRSSSHIANLNEIKNNSSHATIQFNLQSAQATTSNNNTAASYTTMPEQKDEIPSLHQKLKNQEEEITSLREYIDQMEKLSQQGSDSASKRDLKQTQVRLNRLEAELQESGIISSSGNQAQMQMPSHVGKVTPATTLADQKRIAALEAQVSLLTKTITDLLAQQGVEILTTPASSSSDEQAKDEEIRKNLFKR